MNAPARITLVSDVAPVSTGATSSRDHAVAFSALVLAAGYATVRYNLVKGVPWSDWPGYVVNKALAVAGLWLLTWAGWRKLAGAGSTRLPMAWAGCLILSHTLVSLGLFGSGPFPKYFADGKVSVVGGVALLTGALALALLELGARSAAGWRHGTWLRAWAALLVLSALHTALPGLPGWFLPQEWPGSLPPLTLLACAPAVVMAPALFQQLRLGGRSRNGGARKAQRRKCTRPEAWDTRTAPFIGAKAGASREK